MPTKLTDKTNFVVKETGRPVFKLDGENVSEKSATIKVDDFYINLPSIHGNMKYSEDELYNMLMNDEIKATSVHKKHSDAIKAAKERSKNLTIIKRNSKNKGGVATDEQTQQAFNQGGYGVAGKFSSDTGVSAAKAKGNFKGVGYKGEAKEAPAETKNYGQVTGDPSKDKSESTVIPASFEEGQFDQYKRVDPEVYTNLKFKQTDKDGPLGYTGKTLKEYQEEVKLDTYLQNLEDKRRKAEEKEASVKDIPKERVERYSDLGETEDMAKARVTNSLFTKFKENEKKIREDLIKYRVSKGKSDFYSELDKAPLLKTVVDFNFMIQKFTGRKDFQWNEKLGKPTFKPFISNLKQDNPVDNNLIYQLFANALGVEKAFLDQKDKEYKVKSDRIASGNINLSEVEIDQQLSGEFNYADFYWCSVFINELLTLTQDPNFVYHSGVLYPNAKPMSEEAYKKLRAAEYFNLGKKIKGDNVQLGDVGLIKDSKRENTPGHLTIIVTEEAKHLFKPTGLHWSTEGFLGNYNIDKKREDKLNLNLDGLKKYLEIHPEDKDLFFTGIGGHQTVGGVPQVTPVVFTKDALVGVRRFVITEEIKEKLAEDNPDLSKVSPTTTPQDYEVKPNDTLDKVAKENNTTVEEILRANPEIENRDEIFIGQIIKIPNKTNLNQGGMAIEQQMDLSEEFDPEGSGYDYETAIHYGIEPDEDNHWPSRVPETGLLLKGRKHETFYKTVEAEEKLGYKIIKGKDGRYYSFKKSLAMAKGGMTMEQQMSLFQEGGMKDDGMDVDPVSGNDVPPGSLAKEVRDDIPAQLSEGEYVVPADVVQYYGVKFFEDLRMEAKRGLAEMDATGRIGGEPMSMTMIAIGGAEEEQKERQKKALGGIVGFDNGGGVSKDMAEVQKYGTFDPNRFRYVGATLSPSGQSMGITTGDTHSKMFYHPDGRVQAVPGKMVTVNGKQKFLPNTQYAEFTESPWSDTPPSQAKAQEAQAPKEDREDKNRSSFDAEAQRLQNENSLKISADRLGLDPKVFAGLGLFTRFKLFGEEIKAMKGQEIDKDKINSIVSEDGQGSPFDLKSMLKTVTKLGFLATGNVMIPIAAKVIGGIFIDDDEVKKKPAKAIITDKKENINQGKSDNETQYTANTIPTKIEKIESDSETIKELGEGSGSYNPVTRAIAETQEKGIPDASGNIVPFNKGGLINKPKRNPKKPRGKGLGNRK